MAEDEKQGDAGDAVKPSNGGNGGGDKSGPRKYTILGAVGPKDAKPAELDWKVIAEIEATTQAKAKEELLDRDPTFPGDVKASLPGGGTAAGPTKLQELVKAEQLWLHAESGWNPKAVVVNQPPPKFEGL